MTESPRLPVTGEVVAITGACSVQFAGQHFLMRIIHTFSNWSTPEGWVWLTGYVLDKDMQALHRRELLVQVAGLSFVARPSTRRDNRARIVKAAQNLRPAYVPKQRTPGGAR